MKQKFKIRDFYNEYAQHYVKLSPVRKYNCYHILYLKLDELIKNNKQYKNILFVNHQPNDIEFITILSNKYENVNFYMTGLKFSTFNREYYFKQIDNVYDDYEFLSLNYQPKFNADDWKKTMKKINEIDLIFISSKIGDITKHMTYFSDKKLIKFLSKFKKAKIYATGFDFSLTNKNTRKLKKYGIKFDDYLSVKINETIREEREDI